MRDADMQEGERQARLDLAAALHWAVEFGLNEGVCNHFSAVVPGRHDRFLINPQGLHWSEIKPDDLALLDLDGKVICSRHPVEPTAFFIHGRVHKNKPEAACVLHTHMPYATVLTLIEGGRLEWVSQQSLLFYGRVAYEDRYNGLVLDSKEADLTCGKLRDADVLFLANHGVIVTNRSVALAFNDLYYLERACMFQVLASGTGGKLRLIDSAVAERTARQARDESEQAGLLLPALRRVLDKKDPGWSSSSDR